MISLTMAFPNMQLKQQEIEGLHPGRSAQVFVAGQERGAVGEVDPRVLRNYGIDDSVAWLELDLGSILAGPFGKKKYTSVSKYPSSDIDLAFEVPDDTSSASVAGCLRKAGGTYLKEVTMDEISEKSKSSASKFKASSRQGSDKQSRHSAAELQERREKQQSKAKHFHPIKLVIPPNKSRLVFFSR